MKQTELNYKKRYEYPIEKARKILEEDGTILKTDELTQLVNVLTLLAEQEAELITKPRNQIDEK